MILKGVVPRNCVSNFGWIACRHTCAQCALNVEAAETFAVSNRGRADRVGCAVFVLPRRQSALEECRQNVIAILLVGRKKAVL